MAEWKKIIVSGSGVSLLSNDSGYLTSYGSVEQHSDVSDAGSGIIISGAERSKLSGIEANATADQTDAEIRAAVEAATDSNVFTDADHSKLNAIEASATADQTDAEIRAAVEAATDSNVFTDADHSKLNAIEAGADVTDKGNVVAALGQNLGTTLTIGDSTDTITIGNDLVVTGDLTVSGNTTTIDVANLNVKDQFINLNDGGAAADGGLVVEGAGVSFGWDNSEDRWAFDALGATEGQTSITSDAFAAAVVTTDDAKYRKNGNIRVTAGEIFIYTE